MTKRPRRFAGARLVVATHNPGKFDEIARLLAPHVREVVGAGALGLPEPEESGASFSANAAIKALAAAHASGSPALADDSGLAVEALDGAPGILSARWAGAEKDFAAAMARVESALARRGLGSGARARFVCALALGWPDGHCDTFEGTIEGRLRFPPRGDRGFGYDPIFIPDGHSESFAEMAPEQKHRISHRARAFARLLAACF